MVMLVDEKQKQFQIKHRHQTEKQLRGNVTQHIVLKYQNQDTRVVCLMLRKQKTSKL